MIDAKPAKRIKDPDLLARLHLRWRSCALCGGTAWPGLSLHHVHRHPRDDVQGNLVMVCGSGATGCHGLIEAHDPAASRALRIHIDTGRHDVIEYLDGKLGGLDAAFAWLDRCVHP
jgi:hypothetical protein